MTSKLTNLIFLFISCCKTNFMNNDFFTNKPKQFLCWCLRMLIKIHCNIMDVLSLLNVVKYFLQFSYTMQRTAITLCRLKRKRKQTVNSKMYNQPFLLIVINKEGEQGETAVTMHFDYRKSPNALECLNIIILGCAWMENFVAVKIYLRFKNLGFFDELKQVFLEYFTPDGESASNDFR